MSRLLVLFTLFALVLAGCSAGAQASGEQTELERNKEKWRDANVSHYRLQVHISCFCAFVENMPLIIEVMDGEVVSMEYHSGKAIEDMNLELFERFATIDRIFAEIEADLAGAADKVTVSYDPTYGFPVDVTIDYEEQAIDDELYLTVSNFEPLP